jgi:molybdopterin-binding protein
MSQPLARLRQRLGLSQSAFAQLLGVHAMTVSKWERGVLKPSAHQQRVLKALARAPEREKGAKGVRDPLRLLSELLGDAYAQPEINLGTLSATNRYAGRVVELVRGDVMSKVVIELPQKLRIGAVITSDSVERMGLSVGSKAVAIIKATEVIVGGL